MAIEFKARVLLELGAELISSDAVAIYELVKNAIDAGSKNVTISISVVMQSSAYNELDEYLTDLNGQAFDSGAFMQRVDHLIEPDAVVKDLNDFWATLGNPVDSESARKNLAEAFFTSNKIEIEDKGHGMTIDALQKCYLTVGTPMRKNQRDELKASLAILENLENEEEPIKKPPPILGEKGIGRLAAMRLGHYVFLKSGVAGESNWNNLEMDWRKIFANPNLDASALDYAPLVGAAKIDINEKGTSLTIRDLQSDWTTEKLVSFVNSEMAKLANPFSSNFFNKYFRFNYQEKKIDLPFFEKLRLDYADAICTASFKRREIVEEGQHPLDTLELSVHVEYTRYSTQRLHTFSGEHLAACVREKVGGKRKGKASSVLPDSDAVVTALKNLGPFEVKFWWFNRGRIRKENNELWSSVLEGFVRNWSGGLLVYRDGFRVYPYGGPSDDWLDLDRNALSASQYKLNRAQIIGYLDISKEGNPELHDQTNREGFRDTPEKEALRRLLRHVFITECRRYLESVDKQHKENAVDTVQEIEERLSGSQQVAIKGLKDLQARVPEESGAINDIMFQLADIQDAWERAKITIKNHDSEIEQYIHLAGIGLQVEFISHELARVTEDALSVLSDKSSIGSDVTREFLQAQLLTLNRRVRVLDMLSIPGRQRKTMCDIGEIAALLKDMHEAKLTRHGVDFQIIETGISLKLKVEKGQILQILDNLFNNSFYWLRHRLDRSKSPKVSIIIDQESKTLSFTDNGPGIPVSTAEGIFSPFVTSKPADEGRGLGLFISRRLAEYNDATLKLGEPIAGRHNTFILNFKSQGSKG